MEYGYARVSSESQNLNRQLDALMKEGIPEEMIFSDKKSGKDFDRPSYQEMLSIISSGDVIVILSIDRLGRNYDEIKEQWSYITRTLEADIKVLDMPLLDTSMNKDILGTFISDLVLQVLSFVAQTERDFIRARQREGIESAKARGIQFGRPPKALPYNFEYLYNMYKSGKYSVKEVFDMSEGISYSTLRRRLQERAESE
jgi:DNA invertase Pin-like site-specific DNA recombinase